MILGFNLISFIALILPPLLYGLILHLTSPYNSLKIKHSVSFLVGGIFSVVILNFINFFFPFSDTLYFTDSFWQSFWIVAPREELSKFIMFLIIYKSLDNEFELHPITYMFYFSIVGLGFAIVENIGYVNTYGIEVLKFRTFGAVLVHMICGMLFGYWIGLGKIKRYKYETKTQISDILFDFPRIKAFLYFLMGLISAVSFHGLWNYNIKIFLNHSVLISILMVIVGLLACKLLYRDLINLYEKSNKIDPLKSRLDEFEDY